MPAKTRKGCILAVFFAAMVLIAIGIVYVTIAISRPEGSPLARMYRTEADLRVLVTAISTYREELGVYPPAGPAGVRLATDYLSRKGNYLPIGPPTDAWGQPFIYCPSGSYADPVSHALKTRDGYFAPATFQVYSAGPDGDPGIDDHSKRRDNICSWDDDRTWRPRYVELQQQYFIQRGTVQ